MTFRLARSLATIASIVVAAALGLAAPADAAARKFPTCAALHKAHPNGIARSTYAATHARPKSIQKPKVSKALYQANRKLDRDGDGVACERAKATAKDRAFAAAMKDSGNPDARLYRNMGAVTLGKYGRSVCTLVTAVDGDLERALSVMVEGSPAPITDNGDAYTLGVALAVYCPKYWQ